MAQPGEGLATNLDPGKRRVFQILFGLAVVATLVGLVVNVVVFDDEPTLRYLMAYSLALYVFLGLTNGFRLLPTRLIETALVFGSFALLVALLVYALYGAYPATPGPILILTVYLWLPVLHLVIFLAHRERVAATLSLLALAAVAAAALPHALATRAGGGLFDGLLVHLLVLAGQAVFVVALVALTVFRRHQHRAEAAAEASLRLAYTDALTQIPDQQRIRSLLVLEVDRAGRYGRPLSLLLLDIDDFGRLRETYGASVADAVLVDLARRLSQGIRSTDTVGRWVEEAFLVVTPETGIRDATRLGTEICRQVEEHPLAEHYRVSVSIGVSGFRPGDTPEKLIERADAALYLATRYGQNQVRSDLDFRES